MSTMITVFALTVQRNVRLVLIASFVLLAKVDLFLELIEHASKPVLKAATTTNKPAENAQITANNAPL